MKNHHHLRLLVAVHALQWLGAQAQAPTPPPSLFAGGYGLDQCVADVSASDINQDGFISRNEEYLDLITRIGAAKCYSPTSTSLTAEQQAAYFTLVCDVLGPDCRFTSELPVSGLSSSQFLQICTETGAAIFDRCPEPTASPVVSTPTTNNPPPSPPTAPSPNPPLPPLPTPPTPAPQANTLPPNVPTPPTPTPPSEPTTMMPTGSFDPVAPSVTVEQCFADLRAADANGNERVSRPEFATFLELFGERVCYERPDNATATELTATEGATYDNLICLGLTPTQCTGRTDIEVAEPPFSTALAYTLCTVTYTAAMGGSVCEGGSTTAPTKAPVAPTGGEETVAPTSVPTVPPVEQRSGATMQGFKWASFVGLLLTTTALARC